MTDSSFSTLAAFEPHPWCRGQGDLFNTSPWGPARMDQGGYPPESGPGYNPRVGGEWLFWMGR